MKSLVQSVGGNNVTVQAVSNSKTLGNYGFQIASKYLSPDKYDKLRGLLESKYGIHGGLKGFNATSVGPTFGSTITHSALVAIIVSLIVISLYVALRFEWKFTVPVLIALMHDLLITAGVYALIGRTVTADTVAALLTILGYSLYDTIIVFDRVRENVPRMPRAAFSQIVNRSMSEVLTRSLDNDLLHAASGGRAAGLRRRHAPGLRLRTAGRCRIGRLLVDLHRLPGADALEGARARLPRPPRADHRGPRLRPGLRGRWRRRSDAASRPLDRAPDGTAGGERLNGRVRADEGRPRPR